ncbi:MAG: amino acid permease [Chlamydiales bacterium]|nr:amino acid permease [Chlamydiales bacterium]
MGGGVYASVRNRSEILSLLGGFFLMADYIITASLSSLSAFHYLGVPDPALFSILAILLIGLLNFWGTRHVGSVAFILAVTAVATMVVLGAFCIHHIKEGWVNIRPLQKDFWGNWMNFVTVILTLSGIETIANMTGVMKLDPGSGIRDPSVKVTARRAIFLVIFEVAFFTTFFSLALSSISGLTVIDGDVFTAGDASIRDYVLRYLGKTFVGEALGARIGLYFGYFVSVVFGVLLLSAVNTAINGMISLLYLMSQDGELPQTFKKLNRHGVPFMPHLISMLLPICILLLVHDLLELAALYAIGFVGAITMNLGSVSTDRTLKILKKERVFIFCSFLIMFAAEITLFINKPYARTFVLAITTIGLILRGLTLESKKKKESVRAKKALPLHKEEQGILCVVNRAGNALAFALRSSSQSNSPLYFLFIREQKVFSERDLERSVEDDQPASSLFSDIQKKCKKGIEVEFYYTVTDSLSSTVVEYAHKLNVMQVVMDLPQKSALDRMLQGSEIREIRPQLRESIELFVVP